jgi:uncharacterized Zn-finger protein
MEAPSPGDTYQTRKTLAETHRNKASDSEVGESASLGTGISTVPLGDTNKPVQADQNRLACEIVYGPNTHPVIS